MKKSEPEVWIVDSIETGVAVLVEASDDEEPAQKKKGDGGFRRTRR